jgi:16S rRNA (cytosine1402-N4)-methyltransferase
VEIFHNPVLLGEVLHWLQIEPGDLIVDMTLGGGGYSRAVLEQLGKEGMLVAFDRDIDAVKTARESFKDDPRVTVHHAPFSQAGAYLRLHSASGHDGAVFDLGVSSHQLDTAGRGFSFRLDGPLDMRMDASAGQPSAADLVNGAPARELARILRDYGEEKKARPLAAAIVERRAQKPFATTRELAELVEKVVGQPRPKPGVAPKHPATRSFQALRIAVNNELGELEHGLEVAVETARPGARIAVVAYHSLEDRFVKNFFRDAAGRCHCPRHLPVCICGARTRVKVLTSRPVRPGAGEVESNRRARSALLRVAEKI